MIRCNSCGQKVYPDDGALCLRMGEGSNRCICGPCLFGVLDHVLQSLKPKGD